MRINTERANARSMPDDEADTKKADLDARRLFDGAYSEWLAARAAVDSPEDYSEVEGNRRADRRNAAEVALIAVPAAYPDAVWIKFELVEYLITQWYSGGEPSYPLAFLALASLKADVLTFGFREGA